MTSFGSKRWQIVTEMQNRYDYAEFVAACEQAGVPTMSPAEYLHKIMLLEFGTRMFPDITPFEAYIKCNDWLSEGMNSWNMAEAARVTDPTSQPQQPCCGGGEVR